MKTIPTNSSVDSGTTDTDNESRLAMYQQFISEALPGSEVESATEDAMEPLGEM